VTPQKSRKRPNLLTTPSGPSRLPGMIFPASATLSSPTNVGAVSGPVTGNESGNGVGSQAQGRLQPSSARAIRAARRQSAVEQEEKDPSWTRMLSRVSRSTKIRMRGLYSADMIVAQSKDSRWLAQFILETTFRPNPPSMPSRLDMGRYTLSRLGSIYR
jgi:hypothetical protein